MFEATLSELEAGFSGQLSVAFYDFETGESFLHRAERQMRSASLIKLPLLVLALERVAGGTLQLDRRYALQASDQVGGAGVLQALQAGLALTLQDLLTLMMIVSDNTATNMVIDILGEAQLNSAIQSLGLQQTHLVGKLQLPAELQNDLQRRGESNSTTALDILGLLVRLEQGDLLPDELTELARGILKKQQFTEALARYLPRDAELDTPHVVVASKSGCLRGLWHDAGIIYSAAGVPRYALVVMTDEASDRSYSHEQEGMMLIARLSQAIYEGLSGS
jgi:beta-lactamase class A